MHNALGAAAPNLDEPEQFKTFFRLIQELNNAGILLAYHDRSDGGLLATLCEMAFAGNSGLEINLGELDTDQFGPYSQRSLVRWCRLRRRIESGFWIMLIQRSSVDAHTCLGSMLGHCDSLSTRHSAADTALNLRAASALELSL